MQCGQRYLTIWSLGRSQVWSPKSSSVRQNQVTQAVGMRVVRERAQDARLPSALGKERTAQERGVTGPASGLEDREQGTVTEIREGPYRPRRRGGCWSLAGGQRGVHGDPQDCSQSGGADAQGRQGRGRPEAPALGSGRGQAPREAPNSRQRVKKRKQGQSRTTRVPGQRRLRYCG